MTNPPSGVVPILDMLPVTLPASARSSPADAEMAALLSLRVAFTRDPPLMTSRRPRSSLCGDSVRHYPGTVA